MGNRHRGYETTTVPDQLNRGESSHFFKRACVGVRSWFLALSPELRPFKVAGLSESGGSGMNIGIAIEPPR